MAIGRQYLTDANLEEYARLFISKATPLIASELQKKSFRLLPDEAIQIILALDKLFLCFKLLKQEETDTSPIIQAIQDTINKPDGLGNTLLIWFAIYSLNDLIGISIALGADPNIPGGTGHTPLMHAINLGDLSTVKALIDAKADVNIKNKAGFTAIMLTPCRNQSAIKAALAKAGADLELTDSTGRTAVEYDIKTKKLDCAKVLLSYGAKVKTRVFITALGLFRDDPAGRDTLLQAYKTTGKQAAVKLISDYAGLDEKEVETYLPSL
jgi:ankyrin repeat protein